MIYDLYMLLDHRYFGSINSVVRLPLLLVSPLDYYDERLITTHYDELINLNGHNFDDRRDDTYQLRTVDDHWVFLDHVTK